MAGQAGMAWLDGGKERMRRDNLEIGERRMRQKLPAFAALWRGKPALLAFARGKSRSVKAGQAGFWDSTDINLAGLRPGAFAALRSFAIAAERTAILGFWRHLYAVQ
jgi:hypothetical protein